MKLIDYLKDEDLTFQAFADRAKMLPQAIHKYAHGVQYPRPANAAKIVKASKGKVTLADIYGGQNA